MRVQLPPPPDGVTFEIAELVPVPLIDREAFVQTRLAMGGFVLQRCEQRTSSCGWPMAVAWGRRGEVPTLRGFVEFLDVGGLVEAVGDLDAALAALLEVRPDYAGELAAVSQLFK